MERVIVITGGSSGIGQAIGRAFAENGAQVVILGRHEEKLKAAALEIGTSCSWQCADVSQRQSVEKAVHAIVEQCGTVDVLINNAGASRGMSSDMDLGQAEQVWDQELDVNLKGTFLMSWAIAPHLRRPGGRIINISSDGALPAGLVCGRWATSRRRRVCLG